MTETLKIHRDGAAGPIRIPGPRHVTILMGLMNGGRFIDDQLDSLVRQHHQDWSLIVGDDGSADDGPARVARFADIQSDRTIRRYRSAGRGFARNYLSLLLAAGPKTPYAAFADQDDVWFADKLSRAVGALARLPRDVPALYCARTTISDADLSVRGMSPLFRKPPGFGNALVQSIAGANTMVMNRAALDLLQAAAARDVDPVSHDWWAYQMIAGAGGRVIYDPEPALLYRQHDRNLVGSNRGLSARLSRIRRLFGGTFTGWTDRNLAALTAASDLLTEENRRILDAFIAARAAGPLSQLGCLGRLGIRRQTIPGTLALHTAAALGRL